MNTVDYLLKTNFLDLEPNQKMEIVQLGPHKPEDFKMHCKKDRRHFKTEWFNRKPWLTASLNENSLYCFYCLLFTEPGERRFHGVFVNVGSQDINHLKERSARHESSEWHLINAYKYKLAKLNQNMTLVVTDMKKHDSSVRKNRYALDKVIQSLRFCCANKQLMNVGEMRASVLNVLHLLGVVDSVLERYLSEPTMEKLTSFAGQQELMECMHQVYLEEVKTDIGLTNFVSLQVDEMSDSSAQTHLCVILRYLKDSKLMERFISLVPLNNRSTEGVVNAVLSMLKDFNPDQKLVSQSFGAMKCSGQSVHMQLSKTFLSAKHVHSYAHELHYVIEYSCYAKLRQMRLFFAQISGFTQFFSSDFPKRSEFLKLFKEPLTEPLIFEKKNVVRLVRENQETILKCLNRIIETDTWDLETVREAYNLKILLNDDSFLFFLNFFCALLKHIDDFYNCLRVEEAGKTYWAEALDTFEQAMFELSLNAENFHPLNSSEEIPNKRIKLEQDCDLLVTAREACGVVTNEIKERFGDCSLYDSFLILNPNNFRSWKRTLPLDRINYFAKAFMPVNTRDKFRNELSVVRELDRFKSLKSCSDFFRVIRESALDDTFTEIYKALQIVITTPVLTSESARTFTTLRNVESFVRNAAPTNECCLNAMTALMVHSDEIADIQDFNSRVIDLFAKRSLGRNMPLVYAKDLSC